jgi:hypothetical protein
MRGGQSASRAVRRTRTRPHMRFVILPDNDVYSGPPSKRLPLLGGSVSAGLTLQFTMSFSPSPGISPGRKLVFRDRARLGDGGARRDRTDDLMLAKHALYQLSYGPFQEPPLGESCRRPVRPRSHTRCGGPRQTRTADLTLIRRVL